MTLELKIISKDIIEEMATQDIETYIVEIRKYLLKLQFVLSMLSSLIFTIDKVDIFCTDNLLYYNYYTLQNGIDIFRDTFNINYLAYSDSRKQKTGIDIFHNTFDKKRLDINSYYEMLNYILKSCEIRLEKYFFYKDKVFCQAIDTIFDMLNDNDYFQPYNLFASNVFYIIFRSLQNMIEKEEKNKNYVLKKARNHCYHFYNAYETAYETACKDKFSSERYYPTTPTKYSFLRISYDGFQSIASLTSEDIKSVTESVEQWIKRGNIKKIKETLNSWNNYQYDTRQ